MRLSVLSKLLLGYLTMVILAAVIATISIVQMVQMQKAADQIVQDAIPVNNAARNILTGLINEETGLRGFLVTGDEAFLEPYYAGKKSIQEDLALIDSHSAGHPIMKGLLEEAKPVIAEIESLSESLIAQVRTGPQGRSQAQARIADGKWQMDQFREIFGRMAADTDKLVNDAWNESKTAQQNARMTVLIALAATLILGLTIGLLLSLRISRPLKQIASNLTEFASGNLNVSAIHVQSRDEVGQVAQAYNGILHMIGRIRIMIDQVRDSAAAVLQASEQLTAASDQSANAAREAAQGVGQVAEGASEQARATHDVSQTMEELQQTIQQIASGASRSAAEAQNASTLLVQMARALEGVAGNATDVASGAAHASQMARTGAGVVDRTVEGMERIRSVVGESASRIRELEQLSGQIGDITNVISGISDQTNLLALNAAIEAARAGEHGRGFAVVAEEVRKLAERSANSAREITDLIRTIQERTAGAVKAMEAGTGEVENGSELAAEAGRSLREILVTVERAASDVSGMAQAVTRVQEDARNVVTAFESMAALTEENTAATEEMASGAEEVTQAVGRIAAVSQQNAATTQSVSASVEELTASADQVATSAASLSGIAKAMQELVASFRV